MKLLIQRAQVLSLALASSSCAFFAADPWIDQRPAVRTSELNTRFGYPKCVVSIPLSQAQAISRAASVGATGIDKREDWQEFTELMIAGDELRHVWCHPRRGPGGVDFIGIFRGQHLVAELHTVFVD
jgi:hypothetical protein